MGVSGSVGLPGVLLLESLKLVPSVPSTARLSTAVAYDLIVITVLLPELGGSTPNSDIDDAEVRYVPGRSDHPCRVALVGLPVRSAPNSERFSFCWGPDWKDWKVEAEDIDGDPEVYWSVDTVGATDFAVDPRVSEVVTIAGRRSAVPDSGPEMEAGG